MKTKVPVCALGCLATLLTLLSVPSWAQTRIGNVVQVALESPHPVLGSWRGEASVPGAALLKVRLSEVRLGPSGTLVLSDSGGSEAGRWCGADVPEWLPSVPGDRVILEIQAGPEAMPWGVRVEEVAAAWPELLAARAETICSIDDRMNAACYTGSKAETARAVGRISFVEGGNMSLCTGSLVSERSHFLTNNHCISTPQGASSIEAWWGYEYETCEGGAVLKDSVTRGAELLLTDPTLDFTLLRFGGDDPARRYGHLVLDPREAQQGETIWVPQHPYGNPKTFAVVSDMDGGGPATVQLASVDGNAPGVDIGYYADTQGGSSGSPVLREDGTVVALHHWGTAYGACKPNDMNQGVKMSLIYPLVEPLLRSCTISCSATAPPTAFRDAPTAFSATATGQGCTGEPTYAWEFGDGGAAEGPDPTHLYAGVGTFTWTVRVAWSGGACTRSGHIDVLDPAIPKPGDCDGDGTVSIGEVQKAINMFLGVLAIDCGVDCDGDEIVSIGEVQKVINGFLGLAASC